VTQAVGTWTGNHCMDRGLPFDLSPSVIPDHAVNWKVNATATDGVNTVNVWSDSDQDTVLSEPYTIHIDRTLPWMDSVRQLADQSGDSGDLLTFIEVEMNDSMDPISIQHSDFSLDTSFSGHFASEARVGGINSDRIELVFDVNPRTLGVWTVLIVGSIADSAGNTTSSGSKRVDR